jgi:hypothetical protein
VKLRITTQNAYGGGIYDVEGKARNGLPLLIERILDDGRKPHVLLLSDAKGWEHSGHRTVYEVGHALGLSPMPLTRAESGLHTITYYDTQVMRPVMYNDSQSHWVYHGFAVSGFDVGLKQPMAFVPIHLSAYSPVHATLEAEYIATGLYRLGELGVGAGDCNFPAPHPDNPPPLTDTWRAYNRGSRAVPTDPYQPFDTIEPNRLVTQAFLRKGLYDVAWELYEAGARKDAELMRRTTHDDRIEQAYVTAPLRPALEEYRVLDRHGQSAFEQDAPGAASDHHGITLVIDTDRIDDSNLALWR